MSQRPTATDFILDVPPLDDIRGCGPLAHVAVEQVPAELPHLLRVGRRDLRQRPPRDLLHQHLDVLGVEGHAEGGELVEHATKSPNIAAERVRLLLANLRAEVIWGAYSSLREGRGGLQNLRNPKVAD